MKVFSEVRLPCEYMSDELPETYLRHRIASGLAQELLDNNLVKFTEEYKQGYYIMRGEVEVEV